MRVIGKGACDPCANDWKLKIKQLWERYQEVIKGVRAGNVTAYPDGNGIANLDNAIDVSIAQQIPNYLDDYVTDEDLATAIQYFVTTSDMTTAINAAVSTKQDTLVAGVNLKLINGNSLLGSGNLIVGGGGGGGSVNWGSIGGTLSDQLDLENALTDAEQKAEWGHITGAITDQTDLMAKLSEGFEFVRTVNSSVGVGAGSTAAMQLTVPVEVGYEYLLVPTCGNAYISVSADYATFNTTGNVTFYPKVQNNNDSATTVSVQTRVFRMKNNNNFITILSWLSGFAQPRLISGTTLKSINGSTLLGSGDLTVNAVLPITTKAV